MVDTRDLKSLAPMSMRVRLPPVLPTTEHREHYEKPAMIEEITKLNDLEVFVYTYKGELVNIKSRWRQKMTNRTDMWENQVELLTRHCQKMTQKIDELESRLHYFEGVVATLLVALKEGGVIVAEEEDTENKTYEF